MWLFGTGWGGDDTALTIILSIPNVECTLNELVAQKEKPGKTLGMFSVISKMVKASRE